MKTEQRFVRRADDGTDVLAEDVGINDPHIRRQTRHWLPSGWTEWRDVPVVSEEAEDE